MQNDFDNMMKELAQNRFPSLNLEKGLIYPDYGGGSLQNLPSSVCYWLSVDPMGAPPLKDALLNNFAGPFQHVIVLLVDGLGLNLFQKIIRKTEDAAPGAAVWTHLLEDAFLAPLTSVVPSTTSAALTTLWTGRAPAEHGVMGYEVWLKELGVIANMIFHSPAAYHGGAGSLYEAGFDPHAFLPVPTLGPHLVRQGVKPYAFLHSSIARSGLSTMHLPEVQVMPYGSTSDMLITLRNTLESNSDSSTYSYAYFSEVDSLSHRFGPEDDRVIWDFSGFSLLLNQFLKERKSKGKKDTLFVMLADHGQIRTPNQETFILKNHPEFFSHLMMSPTCENRLPFLYVRSGHESAVQEYIHHTWPDQFQLVRGSAALESGLFGDSSLFPAVVDRIGDWVVFPKENAYWWWAGKNNPLLGRHGGLSAEEMLVPFISMVL